MVHVKIFSHELISDKIWREVLWILLYFFSKRRQENKNEGEMKLKLMCEQNESEKCKVKKRNKQTLCKE